VNLPSSPSFDTGQYALAFSAGMGWPALATGISAAKKVGDVKEEAKKENLKTVKDLTSIEDRKLSERDEFYKEKMDNKDDALKNFQELMEKEIERVKAYYSGQKSSTDGGE
jgi:wobble nucleotide-excising tRNase